CYATPTTDIYTLSLHDALPISALGIIGGFAAVIFAKAIGFLRPRLKAMPRWTQYLQPAIAGIIVGLIGYLGAPQVMGAGYEYIEDRKSTRLNSSHVKISYAVFC